MGLSIHYSGSLISEDLLDQLMEEVTDICNSLDWQNNTLDGIDDDDHLKGVYFSPKKSEAIFLTFLPGGRLCSPISLMSREIYDDIQFDKEMMYTTSTKTQYAGPEAHIAVIKLLKYISAKYLKDFTLSDEGNYWETGDEGVLYAQFKRYNFIVKMMGDALSGLKSVPGETPLSLIDRIEEILNKKLKE